MILSQLVESSYIIIIIIGFCTADFISHAQRCLSQCLLFLACVSRSPRARSGRCSWTVQAPRLDYWPDQ